MQHRIDGDTFLFCLPDDWEDCRPPDDALFLALEPEDGKQEFDAQICISKALLKEETDSSAFMVGNVAFQQATLVNFVHHDTGVFQIDGGDIAWNEYSCQVDGLAVTSIDYFLVVGRSGFVINCKAPASDHARWRKEFDGVGRSIRILVDTE